MFSLQSYTIPILALLAVLLVAYRIQRYLTVRAFQRAHGCEAEPHFPQSERIIGWSIFREQARLAKERSLMPHGHQRFQEFEHTFSIVVLGQKIFTTDDPENIKALLATNFKDFGIGQREKSFGPLLGTGIFTSDGSRWEHSRALVRPSFTKTQVADLETFETHIQYMLAKIPTDGTPVDMQPLFFQLTLDSATDFLMGESVDILRSPDGSDQQLFANAFDFAQTQLPARIRLGPFMFLYRNKEFDAACLRVRNFVDRYVFKALEHKKMNDAEKVGEESKRYVFLNELAKATNDPKQLRDELLNILLAGRDTTAGLLSNTLWVLARRPDIWKKLQAEVDELNGELPDYETLRNMKYLKNILNEALRLYPSVPGNARFAKRDTTLPTGGGPTRTSPIFIPAGSIVSYAVHSMHRRRDIYGSDADEFKPERWEDGKLSKVGWGFLPFNGGPRICVGQQFAITEASYTLVRLAQMFGSIEGDVKEEWKEGLHLTLSSGNGTKVVVRKREI